MLFSFHEMLKMPTTVPPSGILELGQSVKRGELSGSS